MQQSGRSVLKRVSGKLRQILGKWQRSADVPRLLVVDDQESICYSIREYFEFHGYKVDTANRKEEAQKLIENSDYAALIQDLSLGKTAESDGLDLVRLAHQRNPATRIVVLTAYGSAETEDEARQSGADAILRKPTPLSQVAQVVQGLIESRRARGAAG
jgi:DNA-binding response OmpR family regulator